MSLSHEHTKYEWLDYERAREVLRYDSNKVALWELDRRIRKSLLIEKMV
jgi:dATP pyrophosphohydrolase